MTYFKPYFHLVLIKKMFFEIKILILKCEKMAIFSQIRKSRNGHNFVNTQRSNNPRAPPDSSTKNTPSKPYFGLRKSIFIKSKEKNGKSRILKSAKF